MVKNNEIDFTLKDFNYISDIHADFYTNSSEDFETTLDQWIKNSEKSDVLICAGDIANRNKVSLYVLNCLAERWKYVFFTDGNHDLYDSLYYADRKPNRLDGLISLIKNIDNIYYLSRENIFTFNNDISIGGCNLWYDLDNPEVFSYVLNNMNDARYVGMKYMEEESRKDLEFYKNVIHRVDVFVSHVPVIDEFKDLYGYSSKSYYRNVELYDDKIYVYGHMHEGRGAKVDGLNSNFLSKPIGYCPDKDFSFGYFSLYDI